MVFRISLADRARREGGEGYTGGLEGFHGLCNTSEQCFSVVINSPRSVSLASSMDALLGSQCMLRV